MTKLKSILSVSVAAAMLLMATSCQSVAFVSTLNAVVAAADAAVTTLSATGAINPIASALIVKYLDAVSTASGTAATELASSDTTAEKSRKIAEAFALAALPNLSGVPPVLASWIKAVDVAVQAFLVNFHPTTGVSAHVSTTVVKPTFMQKRQLASIHSHAEALKARLAKAAYSQDLQ